MKLRLTGLFLPLLISGCASSIPAPTVIERDGIDAIVLTDDHKVSYIKQQGHVDRICASVESDAVATDESSLSIGIFGIGKSDSSGAHSGRGEVALGGRNPLVLISREFLYRACELVNNLNSNEDKAIQIYKMFLDSLEKIAETRPTDGTTALAAPEPGKGRVTLPKDQSKKKSDDNSSVDNKKADDKDSAPGDDDTKKDDGKNNDKKDNWDND